MVANTTNTHCSHNGSTYESKVEDGGFPGTRCSDCDRLLNIKPISEW